MSKESKVGVSGIRKKDTNDSILPANESQDALNIHDMSSEYVSDQSDPSDPSKVQEFLQSGEGKNANSNAKNPVKKTASTGNVE